jgi:solute carrier family 32 (vesicular inhibitory amino acid transporter)
MTLATSNERRPLFAPRQTHSFLRQPLPERVGSYTADPSGKTSHVRTFVNSVNILIGAGLLSLPLAFRYTGWILGFVLLSLAAGMSAYAAHWLTKCLDEDASLQSYSDIAGAAFGAKAQFVVSMLFSLVMVMSCLALTVLFGDSMALLVPSVTVLQWKVVFGAAILPLQFVSLRALAPLSILGILSGIGIVATTLIAGLVKMEGPGSLHRPTETSLDPGSPLDVSLSIGLFLAPWGASACVPSFYRDMKTPRTYTRCMVESFALCYLISAVMGAAGYLMFGDSTAKEIIFNILSISSEYPHVVVVLMVICTSLMPVTKATLM